MYRVELKALALAWSQPPLSEVPNVPCGVESAGASYRLRRASPVPNVPCGVESGQASTEGRRNSRSFLMYRVELKAQQAKVFLRKNGKVPNVPCGVESMSFTDFTISWALFLMYRVELKVGICNHKRRNLS